MVSHPKTNKQTKKKPRKKATKQQQQQLFEATLCWCNFIQNIRNKSCLHSSYKLKNLNLGPIFSLYAAVTSPQKTPEKFNAMICYKKNSFSSFFCPKTPVQDFSQKIIWVNFKPLCCSNFMQKIHAPIFHKTQTAVRFKTYRLTFHKD